MIKINKNLVQFCGLLLFLGGAVVFTVEKFFPFIGHATYYCQSLIQASMIPIPYYLSFLPFLFLSVILVGAVIKFIISYHTIYLLKHSFKEIRLHDSKVRALIKRLDLQEKIIFIQSDKPQAFCLGIRKPKIYLSTGLLFQLTIKELEAVVRHEQYHLKNHDTLTMTIASVVYSLFPFFPLLDDLSKKHKIEREIQADRFAISQIKDSSPLISALKKLLTFPTTATIALAAIADEDTLEPRIHALLQKRYNGRQFRIKHMFITLLSLFILGTTLITPVYAKEIHHEKHDLMMVCSTNGECIRSCTSEKNMDKLYSETPKIKNMSEPNTSHRYVP